MSFRHALSAGLFGMATVLASAPLMAQGSPAAPAAQLEEITVTARKIGEKLSDAPLSITAFSAADIEQKAFKTLEDVARSAPGVQYSQQGGQIPGRYTSAIRFRGMNVNSDSPSLQLGALFIDGVYVLGGTQSIPYDDIERIEVIKGPQSATYGRSTFGGAINYITRAPSLTQASGQVSASGANFGESDISASYEMPLIEDRLALRIGGRYYARGRVMSASDGGSLGEESSKSVQLTLLAKPIDALEIKVRAFHDLDEDGTALGGIVQGWRNDSCTGKTVATQDPAVPVASPVNYICGAVPEQGSAIASNGSRNVIDTITSLRPPQAALNGTPNVLIDNLVNRPQPAGVSVPSIDHMGLIRTVTRVSLSAEYSFANGYKITGQASHNELKANWIRPFGLSPNAVWFSRDPQDSTDKSFELRVNSPTDGKFTWLAGVNYYNQEFIQSGSGGDTEWLCLSATVRPVGSACTGVNFFTANSLVQNTDKVTNTGIYASLNYAFTDQWSLSLEGRYQKDKTTGAVFSTAPTIIEDKSFLPRAIVRFKPMVDTTLYASFAKGLLPGTVNTGVARATPRELAQYQAQFPSVAGTVEGDKLDMFEIGWKQQFLDRRATLNASIYWGKWKNQKGRTLFIIQEDCGSFGHGGAATANAANGCANGATGLPAVFANGAPFTNSRNANVGGSSKLSGLELEGRFLATDNLELSGSFTYAKTEYEDFIFNFVNPIARFTQMKGNSNARFPKYSGSFDANYKLPFKGDWGWYVNGNLSYTGKTFVDESNLAYCKGYTLGNARVGAEKDGVRIEGFVRNLFDTKAWAACARWTDFDSAPSLAQLTTYQGVAVSPQIPRQVGLRAVYKF